MVRFNDSWFVFHESSWNFHETYLAENEYFANRRVSKTQNGFNKLINKYQIIGQYHDIKKFLSTISTSTISSLSKCFVNIIFYGAEKKNKLKRWEN